jgi:transposase
MSQSNQYVGLDVSLKETSICVIDDAGKIVWRGQVDSTPEAIASAVKQHAPHAVRIGLESGQLSTWLFHELKKADLPVICVDARHAKAALSLKVNKTDANDALGLAQIMRVGWYREVTVKGLDCQAVRALLVARAQIVSQITTLKNCVRGILKTFGSYPKACAASSRRVYARRSTGIRYLGRSSSRRCWCWRQHGPNSSYTTRPSFNALAATTLPAS